MKISKGFRREFVEICTDGDGTFYYKKKKRLMLAVLRKIYTKLLGKVWKCVPFSICTLFWWSFG